MRYWWVNQNQTYRHEVSGGYLWSPKRKANQAANPFYDFMREVSPGGVIFSFSETLIRAIGIRTPVHKPIEFAKAIMACAVIEQALDKIFGARADFPEADIAELRRRPQHGTMMTGR